MNTNNIAHEKMIVNLKSLFKGLPKFTQKELHHTCPKHLSKPVFIKVVTTYPLHETLEDTGLLALVLNFGYDYNWKYRNFCRSSRKLESRWHTGHRKITRFFVWAYYCEIIEPYGMWLYSIPGKAYLVPVWILTNGLLDLTPEKVYKWAEKFGF